MAGDKAQGLFVGKLGEGVDGVGKKLHGNRYVLGHHRREIGPDFEEGKAAADGDVHARYGAIGGIAGTEDHQVGMQGQCRGVTCWDLRQKHLSGGSTDLDSITASPRTRPKSARLISSSNRTWGPVAAA